MMIGMLRQVTLMSDVVSVIAAFHHQARLATQQGHGADGGYADCGGGRGGCRPVGCDHRSATGRREFDRTSRE